MPIFNIGQSNPFKLPVLDSAYPVDVTQLQQSNGTATFEAKIATHGVPDGYTYQWYVDGTAVAGANATAYTKTGLSAAITHTVYCVVTNRAGSVQSRTAVLTVKNAKPEYTYSGTASLVDDGSGNYRLKFLTSGKLKFTNLGSFANSIDVFAVGGGGGGSRYHNVNGGGAGGGGGYTKTSKGVPVSVGTEYTITIGGGGAGAVARGGVGGSTTAFDVTAAGGKGAEVYTGGAGGSGGGSSWTDATASQIAGGSNGGNGGSGKNSGGKGQGTTTGEFGDSSAALYAGGGAGSKAYHDDVSGKGGSGGGGDTKKPGVTNTGGGGGGSGSDYDGAPAGAGGSGIVIIRNKR